MITLSPAIISAVYSIADEYNSYNVCGYSTVIVTVADIAGLTEEIVAAGIESPEPYMTIVFGNPNETGYGYLENTLPRCHTIAFSILNDLIDGYNEAVSS